ncbi:hypothetical protein [Sulfurospirillum arcachonense]|uniref:hypothetical protein n=1 Tax=Sulfurospirillum arcachonense TaxID=57666 RepID=UPI000468377C|nr:hypothetical protein [Sulfurospirillum arcachonense]
MADKIMAFINEYVSQDDINRFKLDKLLNKYLNKVALYKHHWIVDRDTNSWLLPIKRLNNLESLLIFHYKETNIEIKLYKTEDGWDLISIAPNSLNNQEIIHSLGKALEVLGIDDVIYSKVKELNSKENKKEIQIDVKKKSKRKINYLDILVFIIVLVILSFIAYDSDVITTNVKTENNQTMENNVSTDSTKAQITKSKYDIYAVVLTSKNDSAIYGLNNSKLSSRTRIIKNANNLSSSTVDKYGNIYWGNRTKNGIYKSNPDGTNIRKIITLPKNSRHDGIAIDNKRGIIFWTHWLYDKKYGELWSSDLLGNNKKIILSDKSIMESGGKIFYDYIYDKLYISDYLGKKIIVYDFKTKDSEKLTNSSQPEDLVVDYKNKKILWSDSANYNISSIAFDGSNKKVLIQFKHKSTDLRALTIDSVNERLIYSYRGALNDVIGNLTTKLESSNLDGTNRKIESLTHDNEIKSLFFTTKIDNYKDLKKVSKEKKINQTVKHKYDIYSVVQTSNDKNGIFGINIEDLNTRTEILSFSANLSTCKVDKNGNIYWGDRTNKAIYKANANGTNIRKIITVPSGPSGLAIDNEGERIFWSQWIPKKKYGEIGYADLSGNNKRILVSDKNIMKSGGGMFYDYLYNKLYVSDSSGHKIVMIDIKTKNATRLSYAAQPAKIVVDYKNRKVIWSDAASDNISSIDFNGSNKRTLIQFESRFSNPDSLTIDTINDRLVYDYDDIIETSNLDGTNRREEGFTHFKFIKSLFFANHGSN